MEAMEEEIRKLKGKVQHQHKRSMPKDILSEATGAMRSSTPPSRGQIGKPCYIVRRLFCDKYWQIM